MNRKTFISYRRNGGEIMTQLICDRLIARGYDVFYDIESLQSGEFDKKLYNEIEKCENFLLILPQSALDRCRYKEDWVRKEISHALKLGKNIVPVMLRGFDFPHDLPSEISAVSMYNGVRINSMDFFDAKIDKIVSLLKLTGNGQGSITVPRVISHDDAPEMISRVLSIGSALYNDFSPRGKYSSVISVRDSVSICFHIYLIRRPEKEQDVRLVMRVYDVHGRRIFENEYYCHVLTSYDSLSISWPVRYEKGSLLSAGEY